MPKKPTLSPVQYAKRLTVLPYVHASRRKPNKRMRYVRLFSGELSLSCSESMLVPCCNYFLVGLLDILLFDRNEECVFFSSEDPKQLNQLPSFSRFCLICFGNIYKRIEQLIHCNLVERDFLFDSISSKRSKHQLQNSRNSTVPDTENSHPHNLINAFVFHRHNHVLSSVY